MTSPSAQFSLSLSALSEQIGASLIGDSNLSVCGVNTIQDAADNEVCFLSSGKHAKGLEQTRAAAVITGERVEGFARAQLVVENVDRALIEAMTLFIPKLKGFEGVHPTAVVEANVELDPTAVIGPNAYIGHGVTIGAGTVIGPGCSVGENTTIGAQCRLDSNVVVYHNCQIGNGCVIQANSTIGATGFGYSFIDGQHRLIPHNGGVILEDGVEIGTNSCIDRAKFGNTVVGAGTKIDNLVQVAHNVQIGKCCLLAGHVGIAGSTQVGNGVIFAGAAGSSDNLKIGDGAILAKQTAASADVPAGTKMLGAIPQEMTRELRCISVYKRLPEVAKEIKQLHKRVDKLETAKDD
ncbi:MAG: UDP-3-O-(3-hydroxymyristoyl)glucosamine N-acyltransferase [Planctomycetota bacterium]|jgi:UDP-3-O-[3-hydroxymyristoyl] glucosamine N-acyltransferase